MHLLRLLFLPAAGFGLGAVVAISCISVDYPVVSFRCNPRQSDNCPDDYFCCSDDPAAENGELPAYIQKNIAGTIPIFSGQNNGLGTSGMCVNLGAIPPGAGLIENGCPIPCNPTWSLGNVQAVCGANRSCCQTVELSDNDCVPDAGGFRPADGREAEAASGMDGIGWRASDHATAQDADPTFSGCFQFANCPQGAEGCMNIPIVQDCVRQLTVANQRGFCMQLQLGETCPTSRPEYFDACELLGAQPMPTTGP